MSGTCQRHALQRTDISWWATRLIMTAILIRARSVVQVHPGPPFKSPIYTRRFSLLPFSGISRKAFCQRFVNFRNRIAICRPRRHRRHHDLARGFTDCLNFLLTATAPRHSRNGKNINVHSRHIGLWKSSLQNQRSQIRGVTVIDTSVIWTIVRLIRDGQPAGNRRCWSSSGNGAPLTKT
jgi:hypothetical protein